VVTPAVRSGSVMRESSNKRQRVDASGGRNVLGSSQRVNIGAGAGGHRVVSPTKTAKTPGTGRSLPRPATAIGMVVPKPGTQHHALGHGRVPSASSTRVFSSSTTSSRGYNVKGMGAGASAKKAARARRESFKPRPSVDDWEQQLQLQQSSRWGGYGGSVKEEDEDDG
jgi:protein regulator of cytokinesis 1